MKVLLEEIGLENRGYEITHFLYAATDVRLPQIVENNPVSKFLLDKVSRSRHKTDELQIEEFSCQSNWIGFVAVCTCRQEIARLGRRDIVVSWRGTCTLFEWLSNIKNLWRAPTFGAPKVMVENGFLKVYTSKDSYSRYCDTSAQSQVHSALTELIKKYKDEPEELSITLTGHSLGSALATLCAYDLAETRESVDGKNEFKRVNMITVYSFAGPRVGNLAFRNRINELGVKVLRVVNPWDIVPTLPGAINQVSKLIFVKDMSEDILQQSKEKVAHGVFHKISKRLSHPREMLHEVALRTNLPLYTHVGVKLVVDHRCSPYLKRNLMPFFLRSVHHLETYLHVLDGYQGKEQPFEQTFRHFALLNKHANLLSPNYGVPANWWNTELLKGMHKEDGKWKLPERDEALFPSKRCPSHSSDGQMDTDDHIKSAVRSFSGG